MKLSDDFINGFVWMGVGDSGKTNQMKASGYLMDGSVQGLQSGSFCVLRKKSGKILPLTFGMWMHSYSHAHTHAYIHVHTRTCIHTHSLRVTKLDINRFGPKHL